MQLGRTLIKPLLQRAGPAFQWIEGWVRPRTRAHAEAANSVLVLEYLLPLGSCVHVTPLYEALKRARPDLTITVATRGLGLEVLRHSPYLDHLLETPDPLKHWGAAAKSLASQLKQRSLAPDCCLTGFPDQRTRIALLAVTTCRGWRGGFTQQPTLYHRPLAWDNNLSQIGNNLRVASLLGGSPEPLEPKVFFTAEEVAVARSLVEPERAQGQPVLVVVSQNSGGQRTGWHDERWVAGLRWASGNLGYRLLFVGTAADAVPVAALRDQVGQGVSIAGKTSVCELAAVLAISDLVVSLDTGTMHVGRAVAVPMVVLGPSWQRPLEWLPLGKPQVRILRGDDRTGVPDGYRLDEISVDMVTAALAELAALYPASAAAREARVAAGLSQIDLLRR